MAIQTGQILDAKYRIIREVGSGSMGAVYEGENILIHRRVAIKVLLPGVASNPSTVQRFEREAQAAGRIGSEHIVEVLDLGGMEDGSYYLVMEFLEGCSLSARIRSRGRLQPREIIPIAQQLLTGLEAAHQARIIHRDLKPDNVFLVTKSDQSEFVKVLDFGVSKFNPLNTEGNDGMDLTKAGTVVGTPFYMSPEQAKGAPNIDARADLYSTGVILYEAVTGQRPFHAGTFNELIFKIVLEAPPPPEHFVPDLDPAFSRIIRKAMAREANDRYQNADEMRNALSVWLHTGADDLAATVAVNRLPPPPSPGMSDPPPPAVAGEVADDNISTRIVEPDDEHAATQIVEPDQGQAATQIVEPGPGTPDLAPPDLSAPVVPPPPRIPRDAVITDRPGRPTNMPGVRSSGSRNLVVALVGIAAVVLVVGGAAAVLWSSMGSAATAEPLSPPPEQSEAPSSEEPGAGGAPADEQGEGGKGGTGHGEEGDGGDDGDDDPVAEEADTAEPAATSSPPTRVATPTPRPQPKTQPPRAPSTSKSTPSQPSGTSTSGGSGNTGKPKGKKGRTIATEL